MKNITRAFLIAVCLFGQGAFAQGPPPPVLVSPADMTYIPKNLDFQFKWKAVPGAQEYKVWWSGDGINWQSVSNAGNTLAWKLTENYPAGVPFRWKVQALVSGIYSADSPVWRVYDVPGTVPNLTAPADLSYIPAGNTAWTYTWNAVAGATEYEVQESVNGGSIWTKRTVFTNSAVAPSPPRRPFTGRCGPRSGPSTPGSAPCGVSIR